jgi:hypothetical protein
VKVKVETFLISASSPGYCQLHVPAALLAVFFGYKMGSYVDHLEVVEKKIEVTFFRQGIQLLLPIS